MERKTTARAGETGMGKAATKTFFKLFAYGSLKRGFPAHDRFCRGVLDVREAFVWGRLYLHGSGYPLLHVPPRSILAESRADPLEDEALFRRLSQKFGEQSSPKGFLGEDSPPGSWSCVYGELMSFDGPRHRLRLLDDYEGIWPAKGALYRRVIVPVFAQGKRELAWVYVGAGEAWENLLWIKEGRWPVEKQKG